MAALIKSQLTQISINVNIVPQDSATFAARNGAGQFDWDLTGRGMRGDVDGYVAEYHPASPVYKTWFPGYRNPQDLAADRQRPDRARPEEAAADVPGSSTSS